MGLNKIKTNAEDELVLVRYYAWIKLMGPDIARKLVMKEMTWSRGTFFRKLKNFRGKYGTPSLRRSA